MAQSNRLSFKTPLAIKRPFGKDRYEVWSPKLSRRLTLYSELNLYCWVLIEGNPSIQRFCERPYAIQLFGKKSTVDFWTSGDVGDQFIFITPDETPSKLEQEIFSQKSFVSWAQDGAIDIKIISKESIRNKNTEICNWSLMIRHLSANHALISEDMSRKIQRMIIAGGEVTLQEILDTLNSDDPVVVKAAAFQLLHCGKAKCRDLASNPLSNDLVLEVA